jgi:hemin uptake protein HemP
MPTNPSSSNPTGNAQCAPDRPAANPSDESIESSDLFKGRREIIIRHNNDRYILRITRQGKLILNK